MGLRFGSSPDFRFVVLLFFFNLMRCAELDSEREMIRSLKLRVYTIGSTKL